MYTEYNFASPTTWHFPSPHEHANQRSPCLYAADQVSTTINDTRYHPASPSHCTSFQSSSSYSTPRRVAGLDKGAPRAFENISSIQELSMYPKTCRSSGFRIVYISRCGGTEQWNMVQRGGGVVFRRLRYTTALPLPPKGRRRPADPAAPPPPPPRARRQRGSAARPAGSSSRPRSETPPRPPWKT